MNKLARSLIPLQSSPALFFDSQHSDLSVIQVIVHPLVLLSVLDHHNRRQDEHGRVIGTLLGRRDGSTVEVTNAFAVPHAERGDEVAIGKDFNKAMLALSLRCNRKETVVGWYASTARGDGAPELISDTSSLIHEFYAGETEENDPIHLVVDTRLLENNISIRAYKSFPIVVQGEPMGNMFHEVRLILRSTEPEAICLHEMIQRDQIKNDNLNGKETQQTDIDSLQHSMEKLYTSLGTALEYVTTVVEGGTLPDAEIGRQITDTLATLPHIRPDVLDRLFHDSSQDLLMVAYLSKLTRTQLTVAAKLNASLSMH
jgi:translation initiation factor 3 subunit F